MSRVEALAKLKEHRAAGTKYLSSYKVQEDGDLYDEVDEEKYKDIVRGRLNQDDFVVDDNGEGYADDGREDWLRERKYSSSEEELPGKGKKGKKRDEDREKNEQIDKGISKYFSSGPAAAVSKPKVVNTAEDKAFMEDLLGEVDVNAPVPKITRTRKPEAKHKNRRASPPLEETNQRAFKKTKLRMNEGFDAPSNRYFDDEDNSFQFDSEDINLPVEQQPPSSPITRALERKQIASVSNPENIEEEEEDMIEVTQAVGHSSTNGASINISGSRPIKKIQKLPYPSPDSSSPTRPPADNVDASAWNNVTTKLNVLRGSASENANFGKLNPQDALEEDGSLQIFWTDYTEVNGSLCLFGKVKNKSSGGFVSCFVKIDNILRKLFFLPREYRHRNGRDSSEEIEMKDVYDEVDTIMSNLRVGMHKIKPCSRKYAFELPDIPKEADYLKLLYPYDKPALPIDLRGETFSHVFGTNTALFEQFVLWKNIMGPCWLRIEGADFRAVSNSSWCKLELQVSNPLLIKPLSENEGLETPPLTLMSIALRTTLNVMENKQEILMASCRIYENISLSDTTSPEKLPCQTFTVIRPSGQTFPLGFETEAKKHRGAINLQKNEQGLLSVFLAKLQSVDPDVLVGHQLCDVDYSILLSRMKERKTAQWHRIGRMKRSDWPKNMGKGGGSFFAERQLVSGRLLCDLANDLGKSLMTKCQSWSLTEMCDLVLGENNARREIDNEVALKTWASTREGLMNYVNHCEADTYFIAAIALKVQMLSLTKILTNLAGNSWARTLSGTRAERNEYILLHEFHRNKYICPDKVFGKGKPQPGEDDQPDGQEGTDTKKKDKYKGGLVFEPEKGLYDKFILVMDFNSLYPSIIQEYNICFTTIDRSNVVSIKAPDLCSDKSANETLQDENEENVPECPSSDQSLGILPKLIATLVSRRRQVKSLMKDKRATADQLATWDIKQLALKLTANSMYGCLGYTRSRFYARPLAMLTTFKGREILQSTKELAESTQLKVIYGDTDSVMINTNANNVEDALTVGKDFKRAVNDRYKLLEIDIDNVFRRLLLHAKKKYAAINLVEVDGKYVDKLEVKGLDMKRREYCALSKDISSKLLNEILSGEETEVAVAKIHEYLREVSQMMRDGSFPAQKYIIYTKLGKNPKDYPNSDSMPQVQVALREISRGKSVRINDVMSYIITGDSQSTEPAPKRAFTPQDVMKADSGLKPDIEWYLYKQILPPIERLCASIEGTDVVRLAECLGLDTRKYQITTVSAHEPSEIFPLESQIGDDERFQAAERLKLRCRACKHCFQFAGLAGSLNLCSPTGITCPGTGCGETLTTLSIVAQLEHQIRQQTSKYYAGWLVCEDQACGNRTRQMSVYGHRCLGPKGLAQGCLGRMGYEYSAKRMYTQLLYFQCLWDVDRAKGTVAVSTPGAAGAAERELVAAMAEHNRQRFGTAKAVVDRYLDKCGRQWVDMDSLFGFAAQPKRIAV
ncbi:MAG: DNA-directed DNA polymerase alpha catalytic subunit pol1 [Trizodia sp. TS-e1964]|nr:MAG: DNA-directed DNA polymerase alpha catalytic subunit pol1 [Trizodia sp. TS-e1964]